MNFQLQITSFKEMLLLFHEHSLGEVRPYQSPSKKAKESYTSQDFEVFEPREATYSLHLLDREPEELHDRIFSSPTALLEGLRDFPELGIGPSDGEVWWAKGEDWIVLRARLVEKSDLQAEEILFLSLGLRKVDEGYALLIWGPGKEKFATVFGFGAYDDDGWQLENVDFSGVIFPQ